MRRELKSRVGLRQCFWRDVDSTGKSTVLFLRLEFLKLHNYVNTAYLNKPSDPFNHLRVFLFIHPFWSQWKHEDFYQLLCKRENFQSRLTAALWSEVGPHFEEFYVILYPGFLEIEWLHMWKKLVCVCDSRRTRASSRTPGECFCYSTRLHMTCRDSCTLCLWWVLLSWGCADYRHLREEDSTHVIVSYCRNTMVENVFFFYCPQ